LISERLKSVWRDAVWSKVIAAGILAFASSVFFAMKHSQNTNLQSREAVLTLKKGKQQVVSTQPSVVRESFTFHNAGDSIAKDVVLSCGTLQSSDESSHGQIPLIEPHGDVTVQVYITAIPDDVLHQNDPVYCLQEPILSYTDDVGRHSIGFDSTGQENTVHAR
jgi:hypothetical protein